MLHNLNTVSLWMIAGIGAELLLLLGLSLLLIRLNQWHRLFETKRDVWLNRVQSASDLARLIRRTAEGFDGSLPSIPVLPLLKHPFFRRPWRLGKLLWRARKILGALPARPAGASSS